MMLSKRRRELGPRREGARCKLCGAPIADGSGSFCRKMPKTTKSCEDMYRAAQEKLEQGAKGMRFDCSMRGGGNKAQRMIRSKSQMKRIDKENARRAIAKMNAEMGLD